MSNKQKIDRNELIVILDSAAKRYPMKTLARELGKAESSLRNELTERQGYKLGLLDAIQIMVRTGELTPLRMIGAMLGVVFHEKPEIDLPNPVPVIRCISSLSAVFSKTMKALGAVMTDGIVSDAGRKHCLERTDALIEECLKLQAVLKKGV